MNHAYRFFLDLITIKAKPEQSSFRDYFADCAKVSVRKIETASRNTGVRHVRSTVKVCLTKNKSDLHYKIFID